MKNKAQKTENNGTDTFVGFERLVIMPNGGRRKIMKYKVVRYWDTHIDKIVQSEIETFEQAKKIAKDLYMEYYKRHKSNYGFYVFNSEGIKVT